MHRKSILLLIIVSLSLPISESLAQPKEQILIMGVFPRQNSINTAHMFNPLASYLSEKLGVKVKLRIPSSFQSLWEGVAKSEFDIVHLNQYHYVKAHKLHKYDVIVKNIELGEATIAGSIIIRKDSGIKKVTDLKGKVIVFGGDKTAMQSYIIARHLLQVNGLNFGDYIESFAKNPPNAIMSTFFGQSSAAGSGDKVLNLKVVSNQINVSKMAYLVRGEQLSQLPWAVKREMPARLKKKIQDLFSKLNQTGRGKALLKQMYLDGFTKAIDSDYNPHRKIIKEVLNESY